MNERTKLFLVFQIPALIFFMSALGGLYINYFHSYYLYGFDGVNTAMTNWERDPSWVMDNLANDLSFAVAWFMASIPFELWLLHNDRADEENAKRNKARRA